jgi:transcriptional regulator with XRE-family HTH domain
MNKQPILISDTTELGRLIRDRRKALGLSLDEAVSRLGVGRRLLLELEHGRRGVRADTLLNILQMFGLDLMVRARDGSKLSVEHSDA